jgi:hypothetical protein
MLIYNIKIICLTAASSTNPDLSPPQRTVATVKLTAAVSCFILTRRTKFIRRTPNISAGDKFTLCFHHLFDIRRILNYNK